MLIYFTDVNKLFKFFYKSLKNMFLFYNVFLIFKNVFVLVLIFRFCSY